MMFEDETIRYYAAAADDNEYDDDDDLGRRFLEDEEEEVVLISSDDDDADGEAKSGSASGAADNAAGSSAAAAAKRPRKAPVVSASFQPSEASGVIDFSDLKLSRQLLRACKDLGFVHPTPVQRQVCIACVLLTPARAVSH